MKLRVRKLPIILPLLMVAAILISTTVMARLGQNTVKTHTDLGQKYLNDMNYTGAISEFIQSLSMDPTSQEARLGLAEAYSASGNGELVPQILEPLTQTNSPEAYRLLVNVQKEIDPNQAVITAQTLVNHTDSEEDYKVRDELLGQVLVQPHSYAMGVDQELVVSEGEVFSAGSNTLGQLGIEKDLATEEEQKSFTAAQFTGRAARVYCGGRTSYVVDTDGNLWAAGENRWGQFGQNYISTDPHAGWTQIVDSGDVAAVAGSVGKLFVLKMDGTLWYAGQGGILELTRVTHFGEVIGIDSWEQQTAILTAEGMLYTNAEGNPEQWVRMASDAKSFCFSNGGLIWVTGENEIRSSYQTYAIPDTWTATEQGIIPDMEVCDIAADGNGLLLRDSSGELHRLYEGQVYDSDLTSVTNIYSVGEWAVVEQEDGTVLLWDLSLPNPQPAV